MVLRIIVRTHILTSVSLIRLNNIIHGVYFLVPTAPASPSKFGEIGPLSKGVNPPAFREYVTIRGVNATEFKTKEN